METSKLLARSLTNFKTFANVPGPFPSMLEEHSMMNPIFSFALSPRKKKKIRMIILFHCLLSFIVLDVVIDYRHESDDSRCTISSTPMPLCLRVTDVKR